MYALYDSKAEVYDTPVFMLNEVTAKRWFYSLVQKREGRFEYFSEDMELHKITKFNVLNGKLYDDKVKVIMTGKQIGKEKGKDENGNAT